MSSVLEANLSRALSIRLRLQVSLTPLPIVEEWMDIHLTRWLESVPLPPELPMGHQAHFGVTVSSDLSRLIWDAYGHPSGFIPKMVEYLERCKISAQDTQLLEVMGKEVEPQLVGSWIAVEDGAVTTGWQFCDEHPFTAVADLFGDHDARRKLVSWLHRSGAETFRRFGQSIGEHAASEIELAVPGVAVDDQLGRVADAFEVLTGSGLPDAVLTAMSTALVPGFAVAVCMAQGEVTRVSAVSPGLGTDVLAQLCAGAAVPFDEKLATIGAALGADGPDRVVYTRLIGAEGGQGEAADRVDVRVIPTDAEGSVPAEMN